MFNSPSSSNKEPFLQGKTQTFAEYEKSHDKTPQLDWRSFGDKLSNLGRVITAAITLSTAAAGAAAGPDANSTDGPDSKYELLQMGEQVKLGDLEKLEAELGDELVKIVDKKEIVKSISDLQGLLAIDAKSLPLNLDLDFKAARLSARDQEERRVRLEEINKDLRAVGQAVGSNIKDLNPALLRSLQEYKDTRPTFEVKEINKTSQTFTKAGWIENIKKTGHDYTLKRPSMLPNGQAIPDTSYAVGNREVHAAMSAMKGTLKGYTEVAARALGCDPESVTVDVDVYSSLHTIKEPGARLRPSKLPYNNNHPTTTLTFCPSESLKLIGGELSGRFFFSFFNNSNGLGADDMNKLGGVVDTTYAHRNYNGEIKQQNSWSGPTKSNRLVVVLGHEVSTPIIPGISLKSRVGIQYGYSIGDVKGIGSIAGQKNLTPYVMLELELGPKDKDGNAPVRIGVLPGRVDTDVVTGQKTRYDTYAFKASFSRQF